MPILLAILLIPLLEIAVFIKVGQAIGVLDTLLLLIAAGIGGALLLRLQGWMTLLRLRQRLSAGEAPVRELFDAACLALAGVLLILPGFLSDLLALLLLVPPVRGLFYDSIARRLARHDAAGSFRGQPRLGPVIEGDWTEAPGASLPPQRDDPNARSPTAPGNR